MGTGERFRNMTVGDLADVVGLFDMRTEPGTPLYLILLHTPTEKGFGWDISELISPAELSRKGSVSYENPVSGELLSMVRSGGTVLRFAEERGWKIQNVDVQQEVLTEPLLLNVLDGNHDEEVDDEYKLLLVKDLIPVQATTSPHMDELIRSEWGKYFIDVVFGLNLPDIAQEKMSPPSSSEDESPSSDDSASSESEAPSIDELLTSRQALYTYAGTTTTAVHSKDPQDLQRLNADENFASKSRLFVRRAGEGGLLELEYDVGSSSQNSVECEGLVECDDEKIRSWLRQHKLESGSGLHGRGGSGPPREGGSVAGGSMLVKRFDCPPLFESGAATSDENFVEAIKIPYLKNVFLMGRNGLGRMVDYRDRGRYVDYRDRKRVVQGSEEVVVRGSAKPDDGSAKPDDGDGSAKPDGEEESPAPAGEIPREELGAEDQPGTSSNVLGHWQLVKKLELLPRAKVGLGAAIVNFSLYDFLVLIAKLGTVAANRAVWGGEGGGVSRGFQDLLEEYRPLLVVVDERRILFKTSRLGTSEKTRQLSKDENTTEGPSPKRQRPRADFSALDVLREFEQGSIKTTATPTTKTPPAEQSAATATHHHALDTTTTVVNSTAVQHEHDTTTTAGTATTTAATVAVLGRSGPWQEAAGLVVSCGLTFVRRFATLAEGLRGGRRTLREALTHAIASVGGSGGLRAAVGGAGVEVYEVLSAKMVKVG